MHLLGIQITAIGVLISGFILGIPCGAMWRQHRALKAERRHNAASLARFNMDADKLRGTKAIER